jgi:hypothetical protein
MNTKTFYQVVLMGVVTVLIGLVLSFCFVSLKPELTRECEMWNKYYVFEVTMFFTGVALKLILLTDVGNNYLLSQ